MIFVTNRIANFVVVGSLVSAAIFVANSGLTSRSEPVLSDTPSHSEVLAHTVPDTTSSANRSSTFVTSTTTTSQASTATITNTPTTPVSPDSEPSSTAPGTSATDSSASTGVGNTPVISEPPALQKPVYQAPPRGCADCGKNTSLDMTATRYMCPMYCTE